MIDSEQVTSGKYLLFFMSHNYLLNYIVTMIKGNTFLISIVFFVFFFTTDASQLKQNRVLVRTGVSRVRQRSHLLGLLAPPTVH